MQISHYFCKNYYNPWRSNTNIGVSYNRETFRIGVTPRFSGLRYRDYDGNISTLEDEKAFYQYTKFEEISIDINSNGKMILPAIISLVFLFDKDSNWSTSNFGATSLDTTIGPYVSWWQKPYSTTQIVSGGINSGKAKAKVEQIIEVSKKLIPEYINGNLENN